MRLEPSSTPSVDNPSEADIAAAVRDESNEFVILTADEDEETFMQTSGGVVEYREGAGGRHFRSVKDQPVETVIKLLAAYSRGDASYKKAVTWADVTEEPARGGSTGRIVGLVILLLLLAALALWVVFLLKGAFQGGPPEAP